MTRSLRLPRLRRLAELAALGPSWTYPISDAKCWQLLERGLADYDGRGWRITPEGKEALKNAAN
jgi:hypothetical protein